MLDSREFELGCESLKTQDDDERDEKGHREYYSADLVAKAVHLFRNPFDNLVARMHHGIKRRSRIDSWQRKSRLRKQLSLFTETTDGFESWCYYLDNILNGDMGDALRVLRGGGSNNNNNRIDPRLYRNLPCHTEWFRYIQWHNNAIEVLNRLNIPVHILYYEEYTTRYNETVRDLLDFLNLKAVHANSPFITGKTYDDLFDDAYRLAATKFAREIASPACWNLVRHYLEQWLDDGGNDRSGATTTQLLGGGDGGADKSNTIRTGAETALQGKKAEQQPKVALLLSYPNSGTSYTLQNTKVMTNRSTATNGGQEVAKRVPLLVNEDGGVAGPFISWPSMDLPENKVVLTKSHCKNYCFSCGPAVDLEDFAAACRSASWSEDGFQKITYAADLVEKVVHLIRSPYDNAVSRLHHGITHQKQLGYSDTLLRNITSSDHESAFLSWCTYIDSKFASFVPSTIRNREDSAMLLRVPCHSDLIRYVMWHNHAIQMANDMKLPVYALFYENYTTNFDTTVQELYSFLGYRIVGKPYPFDSGKSYLDHYSPSHAQDVAYLVRSLASPELWLRIRHYFADSDADPLANENAPTIAWLLSFPNSGTVSFEDVLLLLAFADVDPEC